MTLARLKEILRRQDPPSFGKDYLPAIRASRAEAPSRSRPAQVWSEKLQRYCHVLSSVEQKALLLALYHPALFELQEQRILSIEPSPHPLTQHPPYRSLPLPQLQGTINVCDRLGMLDLHPQIHIERPDGCGKQAVPTPFIGDFLLFMSDSEGPYCINWTVKGTHAEFLTGLEGDRPSRNVRRDVVSVGGRHAIEERYYLDAEIRTVRIVNRDFPDLFLQNLRSIFLLQHLAASLDTSLYFSICERLQASVRTGQSPLEVILSFSHQHDIPVEICRAAFYRALWKRDVRAELMDEAIFIDIPLKPERTDPLAKFAGWFSRHENRG